MHLKFFIMFDHEIINEISEAYTDLLMIQDNTVRLYLQPTYCRLRGILSELTGQSLQEVQDIHEEKSLHKRMAPVDSLYNDILKPIYS